jgi:hypothetical protein
MTRNAVHLIFAIVFVSQTGCSQQSGSTADCYSEEIADKDQTYPKSVTEPRYKGGNDSLVRYLSTHIHSEKLLPNFLRNGRRYDDSARIRFHVSREGRLSHLSVTLAKEEMFAEEIARVVKKSSCNWLAGSTDQLANGWCQFDVYFSAEQWNNEVRTTMTFNEHVATK